MIGRNLRLPNELEVSPAETEEGGQVRPPELEEEEVQLGKQHQEKLPEEGEALLAMAQAPESQKLDLEVWVTEAPPPEIEKREGEHHQIAFENEEILEALFLRETITM